MPDFLILTKESTSNLTNIQKVFDDKSYGYNNIEIFDKTGTSTYPSCFCSHPVGKILIIARDGLATIDGNKDFSVLYSDVKSRYQFFAKLIKKPEIVKCKYIYNFETESKLIADIHKEYKSILDSGAQGVLHFAVLIDKKVNAIHIILFQDVFDNDNYRYTPQDGKIFKIFSFYPEKIKSPIYFNRSFILNPNDFTFGVKAPYSYPYSGYGGYGKYEYKKFKETKTVKLLRFLLGKNKTNVSSRISTKECEVERSVWVPSSSASSSSSSSTSTPEQFAHDDYYHEYRRFGGY